MGKIWNAIVDVTDAAGTAMKATLDGVAVAIETVINALITAINAIPEIRIPDWVPGVGGKGFAIPHIDPISIDLTPNIDFSGLDLPGLGFNAGEAIGGGITEGMAATIDPDEALGGLEEDAGVFGGDGIGEGMGAAIAGDLVPAFVREMQRREDIRDVIENAVSAREIRWDDVARLYVLGAIGVAEDFMDALNGKISEIGLQIEDALADDARRAAERAGAEFINAWEQGISQLELAISSAFASIGDLTSGFTVEDAERELELIEAKKQAASIINFLERHRLNLLIQINRIQEEAARQVAAIQQRIAASVEQVNLLRDAISQMRDMIDEIEEAAGRRIANLEHDIEVVREWGDAQIEAVRATIDANKDIIDGLDDQLAAKKEILSVDKETLRAYR